jgi:aminopeptidase N
MDEGMTEFNESEGEDDFFPANFDPDYEGWAVEAQQSYYRIAGTPDDAPSMRHADNYTYGTPSRVFASYSKPRVMLHALRGVIGEETFFEAYRAFFDRWAYKHPTPYDFFNTVEDVAGRELDWFWTGAFGEAWTMDHAIASVDRSGGETRVTVADRGKIVLPVKLQATLESGETVTRTLTVDAWLDGAREVTLTLDGTATSVTLDPEGYFPDVDRSNNTWTAADAGTPGG